MSEHLTLHIANIHCSGCEQAVFTAISKVWTLVHTNEVPTSTDLAALQPHSLFYMCLDNSVDLYMPLTEEPRLRPTVKRIISNLTKKGFTVTSWSFEKDDNDCIHEQNDVLPDPEETQIIKRLWKQYKEKQRQKHHVNGCEVCKEHDKTDSESIETLVQKPESEYRAVFSVSGMTCASCSQSVSQAIQGVLDENSVTKKGDDPLFSVNLLQHFAVVLIPNKHIVNKLVDVISDAGFDCQVMEVLPVVRSVNLRVNAVIGGITCAACVNSILQAVHELPFVLDAGISSVTKTGQFVIEDSHGENFEKLRETVESCGFDFELVDTEKINFTSGKKQSRTINIGVAGMFCVNCPTSIMDYLKGFGEAVVIEDPITLSRPFVKFTYIPNPKEGITVRRFISDLNHLQPLDAGTIVDYNKKGVFECSLVEKVSIDEHLRKMARKEIWKIALRLIIATVFAIPTFIFGIVGMSLIPKHNSFRVWLEDPIWVGNVSRVMWILLFLSTPVYFFAADVFHVKACKEISSLWTNYNSFKARFFKFGSMSLLMSLGTSVAYFCSIILLVLSSQQTPKTHMGFHTTYFDSVVFLTFFLLIGRLLESYSKSRTADAVSDLSALKVTHATLVERVEHKDMVSYENDQVVDVKHLESDDYIRLSSGESPPMDCVVVEGSTKFDESALTGESDPVHHAEGHQIFSGTVNVGESSVIAKILSVSGDSLIDQIVSTVRDGQMKKAPIQRVADVITGYFVPLIVLLAVLTWVIWLVLAYSGALPESYLDIEIGGWTVWSLDFAIAVFVIACPCGVGLAAPTALFVGSGLAAKHGILAKGGGAAFQDVAKTDVVCFDKTGTLTRGQLKVTDVCFTTNDMKLIALQLTRDLELTSKHPIATAIKTYVATAFADLGAEPSSNMIPFSETVHGKGLRGDIVFDDDSIWSKYKPEEAILGNEALLADYNVQVTEEQRHLLKMWKASCKSVVAVAVKADHFGDSEFHLVLMLACRDEIRQETPQVVKFLKSQGIECWMITGDNLLTARAIANEIGIAPENVLSEVLPNEKQAMVKRLQMKTNKVVAMVGDGINDAPALATADVGIALASGADLAVTSSDFILLNQTHPIVTLCTLMDLARVVFRRVKFNFGWSLVYNVIGIPIAAGVIYPYRNSRLSPVWASCAMAASSVSVVTSSLLLRLYRPKVTASLFGAHEPPLQPVVVTHLTFAQTPSR